MPHGHRTRCSYRPVAAVAAALLVFLAAPAQAQEGETIQDGEPVQEIIYVLGQGDPDVNGGLICRPGGPDDCTSRGFEPGEYMCETDMCRAFVEEIARQLCAYGIPYPLRSDMTGAYAQGEERTPPIRIAKADLSPSDRRILRVERGFEPKVRYPEECFNPPVEIEYAMPAEMLRAHRASTSGGAVFASDLKKVETDTTVASVGINRIDADSASSAFPLATVPAAASVALAGLFYAIRAVRRRAAAYWQHTD